MPESSSVDTVVRQGDAADQTIRAAQELNADLIVIANYHRPFGDGTVVGHTTEKVARHASVPVLAVPHFM